MDSDQVAKYNQMVNDARIRAIMQSQEQIESSGGRNVDHAEVKYGLHKGTSAKGRYGIMPETLQSLAKGMSKDKEAQEATSIEDEQQLKEYFASHPQLEDRLARQYIETANKSMGGDYDPEKITYAWQWGQNKTPEDYELHKNDPKVKERWAKVKEIFKDPYPYQQPAGKNLEESKFAGLTPKSPASELELAHEPSPQPGMSPFELPKESSPQPNPTDPTSSSPVETGLEVLGKLVAPKAGEQEPTESKKARDKSPTEPKYAQEEPVQTLQPKHMKKLMALMGARRL